MRTASFLSFLLSAAVVEVAVAILPTSAVVIIKVIITLTIAIAQVVKTLVPVNSTLI